MQNNSDILVSPESNNRNIEFLDNPFGSSISKFSNDKNKIITEIIDYVDSNNNKYYKVNNNCCKEGMYWDVN